MTPLTPDSIVVSDFMHIVLTVSIILAYYPFLLLENILQFALRFFVSFFSFHSCSSVYKISSSVFTSRSSVLWINCLVRVNCSFSIIRYEPTLVLFWLIRNIFIIFILSIGFFFGLSAVFISLLWDFRHSELFIRTKEEKCSYLNDSGRATAKIFKVLFDKLNVHVKYVMDLIRKCDETGSVQNK